MVPDPPELNPCQYGWGKDVANERVNPMMFPGGVSPATQAVLKRFSCTCISERPCTRCSCTASQLSCSEFSSCFEKECFNRWTTKQTVNDDSNDEECVDGEEELRRNKMLNLSRCLLQTYFCYDVN